MFLVKYGVPFDVAFSCEPVWRRAATIFYGELDGAEWDFDMNAWKPRRET